MHYVFLFASMKFWKDISNLVGLCCIDSSGGRGAGTDGLPSFCVQGGPEKDSYGFLN